MLAAPSRGASNPCFVPDIERLVDRRLPRATWTSEELIFRLEGTFTARLIFPILIEETFAGGKTGKLVLRRFREAGEILQLLQTLGSNDVGACQLTPATK